MLLWGVRHALGVDRRKNLLVAQDPAIFELLAGEDETLLVRRDTFLVLDLRLHVVDSARGLDLEGDGLSGESLNEDLHAGDVEEEFVEDVVVIDQETGLRISSSSLPHSRLVAFQVA